MKLISALNAALNERFSPGKSTRYVLGGDAPYIELDPRAFADLKVNEAEAENAAAELLPQALESILPPAPTGVSQERLPERPAIRNVYTKVQMAEGRVPATAEGERVLHSYSPNGEWYVMISLGMYQMPQMSGTNHFTTYSYDRHVPLAFFGAPFVPGTYHGRVEPVDLAATFASLLRINMPTAAIGHVLTEAIRSDRATSTKTATTGAGK